MSARSVAMDDFICDSVSLEPFEDAQVANCGHSFSLKTIQSICGKMLANGQYELPGLCPLCRTRVTSYTPNYGLQALVERTLAVGKEKTPNAPSHEVALSPMPKVVDRLEYPFGRSAFKFQKKLEERSDVHWKLSFVYYYNDQPSTGISSFSYVTHRNREYPNKSLFDFVLHFFSEESKITMKNYLKEKGFNCGNNIIDGNKQLSGYGLSISKGFEFIDLLEENNGFMGDYDCAVADYRGLLIFMGAGQKK